jgi:hypothetical protein
MHRLSFFRQRRVSSLCKHCLNDGLRPEHGVGPLRKAHENGLDFHQVVDDVVCRGALAKLRGSVL